MPTKYLLQSASGSGSGNDWTNAYTSFSTAYAALSRGDTLYIGDGSYGSINMNKAGSGTVTITIKKATDTDHGPASGWLSSMGDDQATFATVDFNGPWHIFDGATGGGPGSWISGFGFKVIGSGGGSIFDFQSAFNIARHVEILGSGAGGSLTQDGSGFSETGNDNVLQYCYWHEQGRCPLITNRSAKRILFEYCAFGVYGNTIGSHCQIGSLSADFTGTGADDWTVRYSLIFHCESTGGFTIKGDNLQVYGCIFDGANGDLTGFGNGLMGSWTAKTSSVPDLITNAKFYNNTIIGPVIRSFGLYDGNGTSGAHPENYSTDSKNNLFYQAVVGNDAQGWTAPGTHTHSHNYFNGSSDAPTAAQESTRQIATGNPFASTLTLGGDYSLAANTTSGANLGAGSGSLPTGMGFSHTWNVDMFGNTRTTWTRGAIEFTSGGGGDTTAPSITITTPTASATYLTNTSPLTLAGTASDNVGVTSVTWTNSAGGSGTATGTTSWSASITLTAGTNFITVTASDAAANTSSDEITVTYDPTAPSIDITWPTTAATYTTPSSPISLSGTTSDNLAVSSITWSNSRGGSGTANGTLTWQIPTINLSSGVNVITVTVLDTAGNSSADIITVTYNNTTIPPASTPPRAVISPRFR